MRAARALLGTDQKQLVEMSTVSQPMIERMETSEGIVHWVVHTLTKIVENARSEGTDAEPASRTQTPHQAITHSNQKQKLPDGSCLPPDDPSIHQAA